MHTNLKDSDEKTHEHTHTPILNMHTFECDAKRSSMEQDVKMVKRKF